MNMEKILAVIPCLNEEAHIEKLVRDLVADCRDLPVRIVIADGGSADRTPAIARALAAENDNVHLLENPKRIQSAAVNLAVATCGEGVQWLLRLDAHSGYPPSFCRILVEEARETGATAVVVPMDTIGEKGFQRAVAAAQNSRLGNGGAAHRRVDGGQGRWVDHGHHALMSIDAFRAVGGYDESFTHNEDAELDIRLARAGSRIWLTAKVASHYYPRATAGALFRQYMNYGRGRAKTLRKHRLRPKLRQMIPAAVVPAGLLALAAPFFWPAAVPLAAWAGLCLGGGLLLAVRARDPGLAVAGMAAMVMHAGWSLGFWHAIIQQGGGR